MTIGRIFLDAKEKALRSLEKDKDEKKLDEGVKPILDMINKSDDYYTSSSCAGRIVLIELPYLGDKKGAKFLGKWHRKIEPNEIWTAAGKANVGILWLLAQSPILHIGVGTRENADNLIKIAIACGFKNSGAKFIGRKIIVEVCSTERLDAPIGKNGELFCSEKHLNLLINIADEVIDRSGFKLHKLEQELEKYLSTNKTTR